MRSTLNRSAPVQKRRSFFDPRRVIPKFHPQAWRREPKVWLPLSPASYGPVDGLPTVLGKMGSLEVRLARTAAEVRRAQRVRFQVFFEEMNAQPSASAMLTRRDADPFDALCDHLLVVDTASTRVRFGHAQPEVVGTYRLLRQDVAQDYGGFYTAGEFAIEPLLQRHADKRFLELGRSCVVKSYRSKRTVELLWRAIKTYVDHYKIDALIGCASLEGVTPETLALPLSFLHHYALAQDPWQASALPHRYVAMNLMPKDVLDPKEALHSLPPLIKGYLRVGAMFGDGAVVDESFGTTDVLVILPMDKVDPRYLSHLSSD